MKVIGSTWVFRCKFYPDGLVRKLRARFFVRCDQYIEGMDLFETFAHGVCWTTTCLLLILLFTLISPPCKSITPPGFFTLLSMMKFILTCRGYISLQAKS